MIILTHLSGKFATNWSVVSFHGLKRLKSFRRPRQTVFYMAMLVSFHSYWSVFSTALYKSSTKIPIYLVVSSITIIAPINPDPRLVTFQLNVHYLVILISFRKHLWQEGRLMSSKQHTCVRKQLCVSSNPATRLVHTSQLKWQIVKVEAFKHLWEHELKAPQLKIAQNTSVCLKTVLHGDGLFFMQRVLSFLSATFTSEEHSSNRGLE